MYSELPRERKSVHWCDDEAKHLAALADMNRPVPAVWEANSTTRAAYRHAMRPAMQQLNTSMDLEAALNLLLDPITGSMAKNKKVEGILTIYVDDCFFTGTKYFHQQVVERLRKDFKVGSEDLNDVMFVGQRIRWINRKDPKKAHIQVDQETKIEELAEVTFDSSLRDHVICSKDLHTQFRISSGNPNITTLPQYFFFLQRQRQ